MVVTTGAFFIFAVSKGIKVQWRKPITGRENLVGLVGTTRTNLNPEGQIFIHGEIWRATSADGNIIKKGEKVSAVSIEGLHILVKKIDHKEE
jgi:membrane-bound serine protease (ClpP class)